MAKTACGACRGVVQIQCVRNAGSLTEHVLQGVDNDVIQREQDGHLNQQRQAARCGVVILALIQLLDLGCDLLAGGLVITTRVLFANGHFLGSELCLLDGVLLLLDGKGQHDDLHENGKEADAQDVRAAQYVGDPAQRRTDPAQKGIPYTAARAHVNVRLKRLNHDKHVVLVDSRIVKQQLVVHTCIQVCRIEQLEDGLHVGLTHLGRIDRLVVEIRREHIVATIRTDEHLNALVLLVYLIVGSDQHLRHVFELCSIQRAAGGVKTYKVFHVNGGCTGRLRFGSAADHRAKQRHRHEHESKPSSNRSFFHFHVHVL